MGERTKWDAAFQHSAESGARNSSANSSQAARTNGSPPADARSHTDGPFPEGGFPPVASIAFSITQDRDWCETFAETVQDEIVPRLLALTGEKSERRIPVPTDLVVAVADAAVNAEYGVVESHILSHVVNGSSLADALLDIVGPAARYLGTAWETDDRDFMEVTIGLGTLHQVLASLSDERVHPAMPNRRILLGPTPGEGHTLGLAIIDHLFRAARWDVVFDPYAERRNLVDQVHSEWFAVAGLALAADGFIDEAAETVAAVREASLNPRLRIVMGGPAFERWEGLGKRIGVDAVASDGRAAVQIANRWAADAAEEPER
jgi:methanogenic corrinoid protein MtbC1